MSEPVRALVVTGGHPFDEPTFADLLAHLDGVSCTHVAHPAADEHLHPDRLDGCAAVVLYDMPGLRFVPGAAPELVEPSEATVEGWRALFGAGVGVVVLHHALASWPAWEAWAEVIGGRFHYRPATLVGVDWPDSGYRFDVTQRLTVVAPDHPVCQGLPDTFELTDETYSCALLPAGAVPLLLTDAPLDDAHHTSALAAVAGGSGEGWHHPPMAPLAAWATSWGRSPIVYVQPGDGPSAFTNANYRRLLANAVRWVASPEARRWAAGRTGHGARPLESPTAIPSAQRASGT